MPAAKRAPAPELELEARTAEVLELEYIGVRLIAGQSVYMARSPAAAITSTAAAALEETGQPADAVDFIVVAVPRGTLQPAAEAIRAVLGHELEEATDDD